MAAIIAGIVKCGRGFKHGERIAGTYSDTVKVSESSAASGPHIWIWTECPENLNQPEGPRLRSSCHMTIEAAEGLRDQLSYIIDNHYNREEG